MPFAPRRFVLSFRIILSLLLFTFIVHRAYYTRKIRHKDEDIQAQPELGLASKIANLLALPAFFGTLLFLLKPDWMAWSALPLPNWLRWLGVGLAAAGFALLQWAQVALEENWRDAPGLIEGQQLIVNGPYQWVRHPIYTAFLLILGSILFISANYFIGGCWLGMTALDTAARIKVEEEMLIKKFGEKYQNLMARTGRLLPKFFRN